MEELDLMTQLMVSLGAGLYEELLFRVLVVGAIATLGVRALGWRPLTAGVVAVGVGALIFSAFHYIGPFGDPLEADLASPPGPTRSTMSSCSFADA
jgi:hypothetical protein